MIFWRLGWCFWVGLKITLPPLIRRIRSLSNRLPNPRAIASWNSFPRCITITHSSSYCYTTIKLFFPFSKAASSFRSPRSSLIIAALCAINLAMISGTLRLGSDGTYFFKSNRSCCSSSAADGRIAGCFIITSQRSR